MNVPLSGLLAAQRKKNIFKYLFCVCACIYENQLIVFVIFVFTLHSSRDTIYFIPDLNKFTIPLLYQMKVSVEVVPIQSRPLFKRVIYSYILLTKNTDGDINHTIFQHIKILLIS